MSTRKETYTREQMRSELLEMDSRIIDGSDIFKQAAEMLTAEDSSAAICRLVHTINKLQEALHYQTESKRLSRDLQEDWWDLKRCLEERVNELTESKRVYMDCLARANAKLRLAGVAAVEGPEMSATDLAALTVKHGISPERIEPQKRRDAEAPSGAATVPKVSLHSMTVEKEFPGGRFARAEEGGV